MSKRNSKEESKNLGATGGGKQQDRQAPVARGEGESERNAASDLDQINDFESDLNETASDQDEEEEEEEEEDEEEEDEETEDEEEEEAEGHYGDDRVDPDVLTALGELDAEAAQAYRTIAASIEDSVIRSKLEEFASEHTSHVETLNGLLADGDIPPISMELDEGSSAMTMLAAAVAGMGDRAALLTLIGNEQLTNAAYRMALQLSWDDEIAAALERHAADEQRHLEWLLDQEARVRQSGAEAGVGK
jgi:rubrerythrin